MKRFFSILSLIIISFLSSCTDDSSVPQDLEVQNFVWKGMNSWYNWQTEVPNLSDAKDDNESDYINYLNGFSEPKSLFESLIYQDGIIDRFSWYVEDYVVQNQQFQGISKSFGFRLQAVQINFQGDIIFYVRYVAPNSPASNAGIKRGDIINALDGVVLNSANYSSTVTKLSNETITLSFVSENGDILNPIEDKTITSVVLSENPVHFTKTFDNIGGKKVGYLVYNAFRSSYNDELNAAFSSLKSQGINELILDLRLNGGGSVRTSTYLASMITNSAGTDKFAELKFNAKHSNSNGNYSFDNTLNIYDSNGDNTGNDPINRLNTLNKIYILTSSSTASASEMIINGLRPFMTVKTIGTTTYGKNVGSITLYDSPTSDYTNEETANQNHKKAMQPIVFQIFNKLGESDYTQGFSPTIKVEEYKFWNSILPFGDENEVVLKAALDDIRGIITPTNLIKSKYENIKAVDVIELENKFDKEMFIESDYFNQ